MIGALPDGAWFPGAVLVDPGIAANGIFMLSF
jgi:hypothetical protein